MVEFLRVLRSWHTFGTHGLLGGLVQIAVSRTLRPRTFSCYRGLCLPERSQYGAKDFPTGIALQSAPRRHNFRDLGVAGPAGSTRFFRFISNRLYSSLERARRQAVPAGVGSPS